MPRWSCLVLMMVFLLSVGCGQNTPEPTPENANRQGNSDNKPKASDRASGVRQPKPSPVLVKVVFLVQPLSWSNRNILKVEIEGDPLQKERVNGYHIKNLQPIEGPLPPAGIYFLRQNTIHYSRGKTVEQEVSTEPDAGPFFDKKLPSGIRLIHAVLLGKCKADVESQDSSVRCKNQPFYIYQAAYEKR